MKILPFRGLKARSIVPRDQDTTLPQKERLACTPDGTPTRPWTSNHPRSFSALILNYMLGQFGDLPERAETNQVLRT